MCLDKVWTAFSGRDVAGIESNGLIKATQEDKGVFKGLELNASLAQRAKPTVPGNTLNTRLPQDLSTCSYLFLLPLWKPVPTGLLGPCIQNSAQRSFSFLLLLFFFFWPHHAASGTLVPWPRFEPASPALEAWSLNHWSTRVLDLSCVCVCVYVSRSVVSDSL